MKFNLEIAEFTRSSQSVNGLRHGDYNRYRHFCTRKLQRLRTSLKIPNGKHKFRKAELPSVLNSVRFLQIPILQAERAWAHGLTLKSEFALGQSKALGLVRHRFIRKFYRAKRAAFEAVQLAEKICDSQTIAEAKAYHAWMSALAFTEDGKYAAAIEQINNATEMYTELSKNSLDVIIPNASKAYKHRITDLEPIMRVCRYRLRLSQGAAVTKEEKGEASPTKSAGDDFESVYEMSDEGEVDFSSESEAEEMDFEPISPRQHKPTQGLLGKIGGWWNKS